MKKNAFPVAGILLATTGLALASCAQVSGSGATGTGGSGPSDAAAGTGGTSTGGGDAATPADASVSADRAGIDMISADVPPMGDPDAACATQSAMAETLPLDLYVMMDSSGSMIDPTASGDTKWDAVRAALKGFFNDARSGGLGVALQYFPLFQPGVPNLCGSEGDCMGYGPCQRFNICYGPTTTQIAVCATAADCLPSEACVPLGMCGATADISCAPVGALCNTGDICIVADGFCRARDRCETAAYATPAVAFATLPAAASALVASLDGHEPDGATPTGPALSGALQAARARATAQPDHKVAVLMVTDGLPSECSPTAIADVAALANQAFVATPAIPTFVVGVFGTADMGAATNLNALAAGGGTGSAFIINTNQNVTQGLQAALDQIRTSALACEYRIPPATGGAIDFGKVNVTFTDSGGAMRTIGHVVTKDACDATRGGWYYDVDPSTGMTPNSIIACGTTCDQLQADPAGKVEIVLGCATIVIE